ncbi:hypothetical protein NDU88_011098 [Pleurodeles waltl]|uniref:Uncharacterized protein n=1 Tax=Pleurodeles waltl TaxID=8319 RepID=A0AAV7QXN1_PLEWA|nr:hypothetical protein NDU88_011098 [Pleurodeles waltl]
MPPKLVKKIRDIGILEVLNEEGADRCVHKRDKEKTKRWDLKELSSYYSGGWSVSVSPPPDLKPDLRPRTALKYHSWQPTVGPRYHSKNLLADCDSFIGRHTINGDSNP